MSSSADEEVRKKPFTPTPTQKEFLQSTKKQILMSGSFGAGKSRIGCEKGYLLNLKYPGNRGLIVRNAYTDVWSSTVDQTLLEEVIPESHIVEHNQTKHKITHFTGARGPDKEPITSEIQYHGLDSGGDGDLPTKIGGQQYGWIFVDEGIEISKGAWVQLLGRLRYSGKEMNGRRYEIPFRQIFTATNPASKVHWMYQWFFNSDKDDAEVYRMTAHELAKHVPQVPDDYVQTMESNFTGMYADRYIHGEWVAASGLVYNEYEPEVHYRPPEDLPGDWEADARIDHGDHETVLATPPEGWRIYRSIDFGYRNPFVCYDEETEILTENGWTEFSELPRDVDIATVDTDTEQIEYQTPISYIEQDYSGPMITAESDEQGANFSVTPNHQMVLRHRRDDGRYKKVRADEMPNYEWSIPVGGWETDDSEPDTITLSASNRAKTIEVREDDLARYLGLFIAEGSTVDSNGGYFSKISQKDEIEVVEQIHDTLGVNYNISKADRNGVHQFSISSKALWQYVQAECYEDGRKKIPDIVWQGSKTVKTEFLEGYIAGDGRRSKQKKAGELYTTSRKLADELQRLATELGYASRINQQTSSSNFTGKEITTYTVRLHVYDDATLENLDVYERNYDGKVYCAEVPNSNVIVRRGDRPMLSGNCQWWAYQPEQDLHVLFREIYKTEKLMEDLAVEIKRLSEGMQIERTVADPAQAEDRATLHRHGVHTTEAKKDISAGIQEVKSKLNKDGDGPKLLFMSGALAHAPDTNLDEEGDPTSAVDEIRDYQWKEGKDEPEKEDDHGMDTMRYHIHTASHGTDWSQEDLEQLENMFNSGGF